jgi:hypothetical protein
MLKIKLINHKIEKIPKIIVGELVMKHVAQMIFLISVITCSALFFSCSDSEHNIGLMNQTATVVINLNLPDKHAEASTSIPDRIFRFFMKDAMAQTAPASLKSIKVLVSGDNFAVIEKNFIPSGSINLKVPAGKLRLFEVLAYVSDNDPGAAISFMGTAVMDLPAGETVSVPIAMKPYQNKIIVSDRMNHRVVMLDDITGNNWKEYTYTGVGTFLPSDVVVDGLGRIYISNDYETNADIIRIDDTDGTDVTRYDPIPFGAGLGNVVRMAIDNQRNRIYFVTPTDLFMASLDTIGTPMILDTANNIWSSMQGIDVDKDGMLYILASSGTYITKYNPDSNSIIYQRSVPELINAQDIYYKDPYLYVSNFGSTTDGYQMLQYRIDGNSLTLVGHFGNRTSRIADSTAINAYPMFYGAHNISAIRNDLFVVIDFGEFDTVTGIPRYYDWAKLVLTSTTLGSGWQTFGSYGTGTGQFKFYSTC